MKMGVLKNDIAPALGRADEVFMLQPENIPWDMAEIAAQCIQPAHFSGNLDKLVDMIIAEAKPSDHILVMSNGHFGGIHQKILDKLKTS